MAKVCKGTIVLMVAEGRHVDLHEIERFDCGQFVKFARDDRGTANVVPRRHGESAFHRRPVRHRDGIAAGVGREPVGVDGMDYGSDGEGALNYGHHSRGGTRGYGDRT